MPEVSMTLDAIADRIARARHTALMPPPAAQALISQIVFQDAPALLSALSTELDRGRTMANALVQHTQASGEEWDAAVRAIAAHLRDGGDEDIHLLADELERRFIGTPETPARGYHLSDCAVHNEPATVAGPCDCADREPVTTQDPEDG